MAVIGHNVRFSDVFTKFNGGACHGAQGVMFGFCGVFTIFGGAPVRDDRSTMFGFCGAPPNWIVASLQISAGQVSALTTPQCSGFVMKHRAGVGE